MGMGMEAADSLGSRSALTVGWEYLLLVSQPALAFLSGWGLAQGGKVDQEEVHLPNQELKAPGPANSRADF